MVIIILFGKVVTIKEDAVIIRKYIFLSVVIEFYMEFYMNPTIM